MYITSAVTALPPDLFARLIYSKIDIPVADTEVSRETHLFRSDTDPVDFQSESEIQIYDPKKRNSAISINLLPLFTINKTWTWCSEPAWSLAKETLSKFQNFI